MSDFNIEEIDEEIRGAIQTFNDCGFATTFCCSSHFKDRYKVRIEKYRCGNYKFVNYGIYDPKDPDQEIAASCDFCHGKYGLESISIHNPAYVEFEYMKPERIRVLMDAFLENPNTRHIAVRVKASEQSDYCSVAFIINFIEVPLDEINADRMDALKHPKRYKKFVKAKLKDAHDLAVREINSFAEQLAKEVAKKEKEYEERVKENDGN